MNRLWSVESQFSHTGAMADHRLALRSELQLAFVRALDAAVNKSTYTGPAFLNDTKIARFIKALANELSTPFDPSRPDRPGSKGRAVVLAGRRASPEVHAVVAHINASIDALNKTVEYLDEPEQDRLHHVQSIAALVGDIKANKVQTLIMLGGNPVYDAPADLKFAEVLASPNLTSIHLSEYANETAIKAKWFVPRSHYLEAWGDSRSFDGTISIAQPLIAPLYPSLSAIELLSALGGNEQPGEKLVKQANDSSPLRLADWRKNVAVRLRAEHEARRVATITPASPAGRRLGSEAAVRTSTSRSTVSSRVTFATSPFTYDGRLPNNAWLHETPDFMTKVTWDNYVLVGPEDRRAELQVENDTQVTIKTAAGSITLPCYTIPGQAHPARSPSSSAVRARAPVASAATTTTRATSAGRPRRSARPPASSTPTARRCRPTGDSYELASIQEHWDIRIGLVPSLNQNLIASPDGGIAGRLPRADQGDHRAGVPSACARTNEER